MTCYVVPLHRSRDRKSPEKKKRTFKDAMREKIIQDHKEGKAQIDLDAVRKHSECTRICLKERAGATVVRGYCHSKLLQTIVHYNIAFKKKKIMLLVSCYVGLHHSSS